MLRALMKNGIYQFKNGKLIYIPEGKNSEDCECCIAPCISFICNNPGINYGKEIIGGTTTVSGFPSELILYGNLKIPSFSYPKTTITGLDQLNGSWTSYLLRNSDPLLDCLFSVEEKIITLGFLWERVIPPLAVADSCVPGTLVSCDSGVGTYKYYLSLGTLLFSSILSFITTPIGTCSGSFPLTYIPLFNLPSGITALDLCKENAENYEEPSYLVTAPCSSIFNVSITFTPIYK